MADIRTIDFNSLVTFDDVYEERSITRAAHRLGVTQPTVGGTLARLRRLFEDPLLVRKQGGMVPTPRADHLAPRIKRLIAEMQEALAPEQFDTETAGLTTYISAADYGQTVLIFPLIEWLRRKAPRIRIAVMPFKTTELAEKFRRGQIDIAITIPEIAPPNFPSRSLFSDRYVGVVRDSHPVTTDRVDLDSFCNFPHILVSLTGCSFVSATDEVLRQIGCRRDVVVSVSNFRFALDLVQCDDFIAVLPELLLSRHDHTARKVELPFDIKGPDALIVWHPRLQDDQAHKWLRNQIVQMASERYMQRR